jgi:hypothetical protein
LARSWELHRLAERISELAVAAASV